MKELLDKISSYNLFNYLLPGSLYLGYLNYATSLELEDENLIFVGFLGYFLGLTISRVGSLVVEPILRKMKLVVFKDYKKYVKASFKDETLVVLSEQNNTYRSLTALILVVLLTSIFNWIVIKLEWELYTVLVVVLFILLALFIAAYRKQTKYISDRVDANEEG